MNQQAPVPVPTTAAQDALAATLAALMPLGGGLLVALGYAWLDVFGLILGLGGAIGWAFWWRNKHKTFFPKDLRGGSVGGIGALVAVIIVLLFISVS
ncbi:hypothetical protein SAMN05421805_12282 [Saccharopolyspora antimicrobica]|uniref:Uncharacterized protein n=2 Tax=Saccharopolyspora TaxID=1835 RepID=A0A1I5JEW3_9PSEU|nr:MULTISPECIES: hypothetical protein [Saccharopolyspora]RKT82509.1 hypothetical protein ATL45_0757 [Saccharopolyspora antimicrobica]SEG86482.1 hypothetical protein SAMN02982929_04618 [Saccharopolyspora kobensis]SFE99006.1 hypothetical protein SAMN05216506_11728 [Saccharopolyspora kobensis]SFO71374.1 hypothetical protein SAMN05421805_12282 [Saccharopolyspora antimicrobica]